MNVVTIRRRHSTGQHIGVRRILNAARPCEVRRVLTNDKQLGLICRRRVKDRKSRARLCGKRNNVRLIRRISRPHVELHARTAICAIEGWREDASLNAVGPPDGRGCSTRHRAQRQPDCPEAGCTIPHDSLEGCPAPCRSRARARYVSDPRVLNGHSPSASQVPKLL